MLNSDWVFVATGGEGKVWHDQKLQYVLKKINLFQNPEWLDTDYRICKQILWQKVNYISMPKKYAIYDNHFFLLSRWIPGITFREFCIKNKATKARLNCLWSALMALNDIHQKSIIHGDISPENLIIHNNQAIWIDWTGIQWSKGQTEAKGKFKYLPPEKIYNGQYTIPSEIYSFGKMLKEAIENPPCIGWEKTLNKAMCEDPQSRYQNIGDFMHALKSCL